MMALSIVGVRLSPGKHDQRSSSRQIELLWTLADNEVIVTKGTPQSDWRKTMLRKNGTAAIPRHVQQALKMKTHSQGEVWILWIRKGGHVVVREGNANLKSNLVH
jgi:hypothetical protein